MMSPLRRLLARLLPSLVRPPETARERVFSDIHSANAWQGDESSSGTGSTETQTRVIRTELPRLMRELGVQTMLDIPCGDFAWMRRIDLTGVNYIGADLVPALIAENNRLHSRPGVSFRRLDLCFDPLPDADLVICRDCLVHLSEHEIHAALANLSRSGCRWLLMTTFPERTVNNDIATGHWQPLNLCRPPFSMPTPRRLIVECCTENQGRFSDKALGLWAGGDLPNTIHPPS